MTRRCPVIFRPRSTHRRSMRDSIGLLVNIPNGQRLTGRHVQDELGSRSHAWLSNGGCENARSVGVAGWPRRQARLRPRGVAAWGWRRRVVQRRASDFAREADRGWRPKGQPPAGLSRPRAEADRLGERRSLLGIFRRDHRIVRVEAPFGAILFRAHAICRLQMPFQHFQFLAVLQADDVFAEH